MNIFFLAIDPEECAKHHCDKHVVKMVLELVQMLYNCFDKDELPDFAYRKAHVNHPISIWINYSFENYSYAVHLAKYLSKSISCTILG
jgi:hypothetical protein